MKNYYKYLGLVLMLGVMASCHGTVTPNKVKGHSVAYDGNERTSGIVGADKINGGFIVTDFWVDRYDERIAKYGDKLKPAVTDSKKGITNLGPNRWNAKKEAIDSDVQCADLIRSGIEPTPGWQKLINKIIK